MEQNEPVVQIVEPRPGAAAPREAVRGAFVTAPLMLLVPVAGWSLQMTTTFIHQSQLRSTLGMPRSPSFQGYLSLLLLPLLFFFLQRNGVSIVNIPPGSQRRSACALRSCRVASSPIRAC